MGDQPLELSLNGDIRLDQAQHKVTLEEFKLALTGATADPFELLTSGVIDLERQTADLQLALIPATCTEKERCATPAWRARRSTVSCT